MKKIAFYAVSTLFSLAPFMALAKPALANYCNLPANIDPTGILCQTQRVIDSTQPLLQQAEVEAARRQAFLQQLYNGCMVGNMKACERYNLEMQHQLRHMDAVNRQYEIYLQNR